MPATEIIRIDPGSRELAFSRAREVLSAGGLIIYPTDTFYGLGADPTNSVAVQKIFTIKGRQAHQPILLLIQDAHQAAQWAAEIPAQAERLMKQFWPGPLTVVFKARPQVLSELTAGTGTVGLRMPGNALTRALLAAVGTALTGTSANISGGPSPRTAEEAADALGGRVDLILDGGPSTGGEPSTVVDVSGGELRVVRAGVIKL